MKKTPQHIKMFCAIHLPVYWLRVVCFCEETASFAISDDMWGMSRLDDGMVLIQPRCNRKPKQ